MQIQAVLARRCSAIGELQQHLWRAGWQTGVAQWGVLGQGGQWAAVAGFDGEMKNDSTHKIKRAPSQEFHDLSVLQSPRVGLLAREDSSGRRNVFREESIEEEEPSDTKAWYYGHSQVFVKNQDGGKIESDDPALAAWSVDAMRLVRKQLYRASNGMVPLPFVEHWTEDQPSSEVGDTKQLRNHKSVRLSVPKWATKRGGSIEITNLPMLAKEVTALLDSMEVVLHLQRSRRLEKLKQPPLLRRNWYLAAVGAPCFMYVLVKLFRNKQIAQLVVDKAFDFYNEHIAGPLENM